MLTLMILISLVFPRDLSYVSITSGAGNVDLKIVNDTTVELEGISFKIEGHRLILQGKDSDISLAIPGYVDSISVNTISGDIDVTGDTLKNIKLKSVSGDIELRAKVVKNIFIDSSTGDIELHDEGCEGSLEIFTKTGDIWYYGSICHKSEIKTDFGDIHLHLKKGSSLEGAVVESRFGRVDTKNITGLITPQKKLFEKEAHKYMLPFSSWKRAPLEYTRVDGFGLNIENSVRHGRDFYYGYLGYGFSSKRFDFYMHGLKTIVGPGYLYMRLYSERRSPDAWKFSSVENTLSAILLHEEFADYYLARGFGVYGGLTYRGAWIQAGYETSDLLNLRKTTDWSLFYRKSRKFRENPPIQTGRVDFARVEGGFEGKFLRMRFEAEKQLSKSYDQFTRVFGRAKAKYSFNSIDLILKVAAGYSDQSLSSPFDFTLGGPFTMPGFGWHEIRGDRWMGLVNLIAAYSISDSKFFVRMDAARTNLTGSLKYDVGIGIVQDDFYIGVSTVPGTERNFRLFAGLRKNLW